MVSASTFSGMYDQIPPPLPPPFPPPPLPALCMLQTRAALWSPAQTSGQLSGDTYWKQAEQRCLQSINLPPVQPTDRQTEEQKDRMMNNHHFYILDEALIEHRSPRLKPIITPVLPFVLINQVCSRYTIIYLLHGRACDIAELLHVIPCNKYFVILRATLPKFAQDFFLNEWT